MTAPPLFAVPAPTVTLISPPWPLVAVPVPTDRLPESPHVVVPELKTITVGGTIVGIGIESSSFKHGFVHEGMLEADILIAAGNVVTIRPDNECAMRLARHCPLAHT